MTVPTIALSNGVEIPQVGLGTFLPDYGDAQPMVEAALAAGYRHIDTAAGYYNEAGVSAAIRASGLPRDEIFVTTKLRNGDQGYESTLAAFDASRRELGLDYVDLYLLHWPVPTTWQAPETWKAIEKIYAEGGARAIGVCNFMPDHLDRLLPGVEVMPMVNQFEVHPTLQQRDAQAASRAAGLAIEAYAPLGKGGDLAAPIVVAIGEAQDVTPSQVVLRWQIQHGRIVIPKSVTPSRLATNIDLFTFELTDDEMSQIDLLESGNRLFGDPYTFDFTHFWDAAVERRDRELGNA